MLHLNSKKEREVIIKEYAQLYSKDILKNLPCYHGDNSQLICTCSNLTIETLQKDVNHVESKQ